ncbi:uncharacterized protein MONOS_18448 [Monocercomonoides exilis]|uniref:uncharacterized protein n=1 Tax=Monocercomonoides exilis TaxID=2049356 RepID=UPI00355A49C8|nr:hypothetical protein MONOS_18448 [Monocercomonoides exilis]
MLQAGQKECAAERREAAWVGEKDEAVSTIQALAEHSRLTLVCVIPPFSFVVRDASGKANTATLGCLNRCTCRVGRGEFCIHLSFVITRLCRVPCFNPLSWQRGFTGGELAAVVDGYLAQKMQPVGSLGRGEKEELGEVQQQALSETTVCILCQQRLERRQRLSFCRYGCGLSVHWGCILLWQCFHKGAGLAVCCPYCGAAWDPYEKKAARGGPSPFVHGNTRCSVCGMAPIKGPELRCSVCRAELISKVFDYVHPPPSDETQAPSSDTRALPSGVRDECMLCRQALLGKGGAGGESRGSGKEGASLRQLACGHVFHSECIDRRLMVRDECPMDHEAAIEYSHLGESSSRSASDGGGQGKGRAQAQLIGAKEEEEEKKKG